MIHAVGKKSTKGGVVQAVKYVLGEKDHDGVIREAVNIISGNPYVLIEIEKTMNIKHTYVHTSLSFTKEESEMLNSNPDALDRVIESYKKQLAAGLPDTDSDRLATLTVRHDEKNSFHIHFLTLRQDMETQKTYQPFVKQRGDVQRFNDWNITMQKEHGLENPNSAEHQRSAGWSKNLPEKVKGIRDEIDRVINEEISNGNIRCRKDIINFINKTENMKIGRITPEALSIKVNGHKQDIRFKGSVYNEHFTSTRELSSIIEERAAVDYEGAEQRLQESMSKLADRSSRYTQRHDKILGVVTDSHIDSAVSVSTDMDMGREQVAGDEVRHSDRAAYQNDGREDVASSSRVPARREGSLGVTDNKEIRKPDHKIFNGADYNEVTQEWTWKGSYGHVNIRATDDGYALDHGSQMEWTMCAQLFKEKGITEAAITCSSEKSLFRALTAHKDAGIKITSIKIDGQYLSKEDLMERLQDYDKTTEFTRNNTINNRAGEERQGGSDIEAISKRATEFNRAFTEYADDIEQAGHAVNNFIATIEDDLEAARQEEEELELVNSTGKGRR